MTIARLVVVALLATTAAPAHAQSAEAEMLFRDGKRLIKEGKIAEGCDKLEASNRLESSVGTLLNLADCREQNHQLTTAWATFRKAASLANVANDSKREAEARRRASALEPRLSYLTISVPDSIHVEGLKIARNGALVDPALWNQAVPVDVGTYDITGQAPGYEQWTTRVQVEGEGKTTNIQVPHFKSLAEVTKVDSPPKTAPTKSREAASAPEEPDDQPAAVGTFTGLRKVAIGLGGVGVIGVVAGVMFGLKTNDLAKQSDAICPTAACSDQHAVDLNHDARTHAVMTNVAFGVGGAALVGATVLWFVGAPAHVGERVSVVPKLDGGSTGLTLVGSF